MREAVRTEQGAFIEQGALVAGRYRLGEAVGRGGMATVFRAWDEKLERIVAVKVFAAGEPDADDTARRLREMRLLAAANHPHLVTLFDAEWPTATAPQPGFLVMELVDGESLRRRIDRGGADPELARRVLGELSEALAYLHGRGIVHRDLKPENILIESAGGSTKLVDFGIAQLIGAERITTDGSVLGTAAYLSPEQVQGRPVGPGSDVYALALVVLECLTGRRAFPGSAVEAAIARVTSDPALPDGLSAEWRALLAAMTARDPEERPSAAEVAAAAAGLTPVSELVAAGLAVAGDADVVADADTAAEATAAMDAAGATTLASEATRGHEAAGRHEAARLRETAALPEATRRYEATGGLSSARAPLASVAPLAPAGAGAEAAEASRPRRRRGVLLGALSLVLLLGALTVFAFDAGDRDESAGSTGSPSSMPTPTVTVTARVSEPVVAPVRQQGPVPASAENVQPTTSSPSGGQSGSPTSAQSSSPSAGPSSGTTHDNGHHNGRGNGNGGG